MKEQRGIYNVTYNAKRASHIKTDIEIIEDAIIAQVIMYVKGYHDKRRDKGLGAEHIKLHLDKESEGAISISELLNLGKYIREYLAIFKEPFIEKEGGRKIYEWENKEGIRFRVVTDSLSQKGLDKVFQMGGSQLPLSPFENTIITYYSDRNATNKMLYKNPKVQDYYAKQQSQASGNTLDAQSKPKIRRVR